MTTTTIEKKQNPAETRRTQLLAHVRDEVIKLKELREKALTARETAGKKIQEALQRGEEGELFEGAYILSPKEKAEIGLSQLSKEVRNEVFAHGVASNLPTQDKNFPINALVSILATGVVKGDNAPLSGGINQSVFTDAPFILLSNRAEQLTEFDPQGVQRLKHLRTVLVNGQYEGIVEDLKTAFPWVSFRTADQIDDTVFDKKEPVYRSYDERIEEQLQAENKKP